MCINSPPSLSHQLISIDDDDVASVHVDTGVASVLQSHQSVPQRKGPAGVLRATLPLSATDSEAAGTIPGQVRLRVVPQAADPPGGDPAACT